VTRAFILPILFPAVAVLGCRGSAAPAASNGTPIAVSTVRATTTDVRQTFEAGGVVRSRLTATIASRVTAPVEAVHVTAGSRVARGAALVSLESRALDADVARARAARAGADEAVEAAAADVRAADSSLTLARATHERVRGLFEKKSATAQEWDEMSARLQNAEAQAAAATARASAARSARDAADAALRAAEAARSYASIAAPFDGIVSERLIDPGAMASAGAPLLVVEDAGSLRLHVQVDEARARTIAAGDDAEIRLDQDPAWNRARIVEVGRVEATSHNFLVKLESPAIQTARSGWFGRARFRAGTRRALTVPANALVRRGQLVFVYLATADHVARLRAVVAGDAGGDRLEILAGLTEGDPVVVSPTAALTDGSPIAGGRR
jgi:RND family efflux transporter MFP subunit